MLNNCIYYSASGTKLHPFLSLLRKRTAKNHARTAGHFGDLLTEHPEIGGELVTGLKKPRPPRLATRIGADMPTPAPSAHSSPASTSSGMRKKRREFFCGHLKMAEKEATLRLQGDYAADIRMCDRIETEPPRMADDMFCGLAMRCR